MSVEVCPICDMAGCRHIRERQGQAKTHLEGREEMTAPEPYCPYGFPNDGQSCCGGYCGMDAEDRPPKTYTEAEVQAAIAAAVMEAAGLTKMRVKDDVSSFADYPMEISREASPSEIGNAILALIKPDAMAALTAYRDREVAKALTEALTRLRSMLNDPDTTGESIDAAIRAMIPEVQP